MIGWEVIGLEIIEMITNIIEKMFNRSDSDGNRFGQVMFGINLTRIDVIRSIRKQVGYVLIRMKVEGILGLLNNKVVVNTNMY